MENIYEFQVFKKLKEKIVKNRDIRGQKKLFKQLILSFMPNLNISSEDEKYQKDKYLELLGILKSNGINAVLCYGISYYVEPDEETEETEEDEETDDDEGYYVSQEEVEEDEEPEESEYADYEPRELETFKDENHMWIEMPQLDYLLDIFPIGQEFMGNPKHISNILHKGIERAYESEDYYYKKGEING